MISPVLTPGTVTVDAYVPPGRWYSLFDYTSSIGGGRTITLDAPEEAINVHVRGGAVLAMQDAALTTAVARKSGFELLVVLSTPNEGRNATGELFVDDGETVEMGGEDSGWSRMMFIGEADENGAKVKGVVENGGYASEKKLLVKKVVFLGMEVKSAGRVEGLNMISVEVNGERGQRVSYTRASFVSRKGK